MDATSVVRSRPVPHITFHREPVPPAADVPSARALAAHAIWLALACAWAELGLVLGHRALVGTVTQVSVRHNWHHVSLRIVAYLAFFGLWWVVSCAALWAGRRSPRWARRADRMAAAAGCFVAAASPLLALEELHSLGSLLLGVGLTARLTPLWLRRRAGVVSRSLVPLVGASVLLGVVSFAWERTREARALAALPAPAKAATRAPNVVLVVLDAVRADHLSAYGYHRPTTPFLAALAGRGVRFDTARATASWTLPSHSAMFTGRLPHEITADVDRPLDTTFPTLAEFLGRHGYVSGGFVGNTFYCNAWFGVDRGFTRYEDSLENRAVSLQETFRSAALGRRLMPVFDRAGLFEGTAQNARPRTAAEVNDSALAWLDRRGDRPFFLFLNYYDAHSPYVTPKEFPQEFCRLKRSDVYAVNNRAYMAFSPLHNSGVADRERAESGAELARVGPDAYDDCLRYLDSQVARLMGELRRRGLEDSTWVVITADHGEHFGEHDQFWHGSSLYRPVLDVPLLIVPPGGTTARQVAAPVSLRDLPATLADAVGLSGESPFPGGSLRGYWDDATTVAAGGASGPPVSEMKVSGTRTPDDDSAVVVVSDDRIYHRSLSGREELYELDDRDESDNLLPDPDDAGSLAPLRSLAESIFRGGP